MSAKILFVFLGLLAIYGNVYACQSTFTQQFVSCRKGWFLHGEKCFKMFNERKRWRDASDSCAAEGGHLATISSKDTQEFIVVYFMINGKHTTWIGLNDLEIEGNYTWQDGSALTYTNWGPGEPSFRHERCVEIIYGNLHRDPQPYWGQMGIWNDAGCDSQRTYICQVDACQGAESLSPDPRFCSIEEGGGLKFRESCYHIVDTKMAWQDAQRHCEENFSGNLVNILDREAEVFLNYILSDVTTIGDDFWIGIRKENVSVQKWSSGWHVVYNRFNHRLEEYPSDTCVVRTHHEFWTFAHCSIEFPFICERTRIEAPVLAKAPEGWVCPQESDKWMDLEGEKCYIFGRETNRNWYQAKTECENHYGTLASITSEEESRVLQHYVITNRPVSIGLHRSVSDRRQFQWLDGSFLKYTNWADREPNSEEEECVDLFSDTMKWNDNRCFLRGRTYICSAFKVPPSRSTAAP